MRRRIGPRYLLIPAILAIGIGIWYLNSVDPGAPPKDTIRTVRTAYPDETDLEDRFTLRAFVEADRTVTVLPLVSGTIQRMETDLGDAVAAGEVVARIDPAPYRLALAQAEASFTAAESTFQRTRRLFEADATTPQNYEHARAQYEAARSQRDLAQLQLSYTTVASPIDGVVLARHLAEGDVASPERPLLTVGDITRLVVRAAVPEERYRRFATAGNTIQVRVEVAGTAHPATIRTVAPYINAETRTFQVVCDIPVDGEAGEAGEPAPGLRSPLRPGMSVTVVFVLDTVRDVLTLPQTARGYGDTLWYVEDGRAQSMPVPDLFSNGEYIQISRNDAHRRFIVGGHHFLTDGQPVEIAGEQ